VRLHWPRDPLRRPQSERSDVQLLQMGYLPSGDDVWRRPEERRVRLRLRLPLKAACCRAASTERHLSATAIEYSLRSPFNLRFQWLEAGMWLRLLHRREFELEPFGWGHRT
jgi:hypothetical protein